MNAYKILIYTFCLVGMNLIRESDGQTCQQNGDRSYQLKWVENRKTWNVHIMPKIRPSFRRNPTTWFFNTTTRQLYCCHSNVTYYKVVKTDERVESSESAMANDGWRLSYDKKMRKRIFQHESSKLYLTAKSDGDLTAKGKRLYLSNELKQAMIYVIHNTVNGNRICAECNRYFPQIKVRRKLT